MNTDTPRNRTLADLPDQTIRHREQLASARQLLGSHERKVVDVNAQLEKAQLALRDAEARTAELEKAVRNAGDRERGQCAADFGVHTLRVADLRKALAVAQTRHAAELPQATSDVESTRGYIASCEASILTAQLRNAVELYKQRIADANLVRLGEYVRECAARAKVRLGDTWREHPGLLGKETPTTLGTLELHLKFGEFEDFAAALKPKPAPPPEPLRAPSLAATS
jgi:chromosome segregation ATPase